MSASRIPIQNIYYLLSYAWGVLPEAELASLSATPGMRLQDLLARVLITAVTRLLKQGPDRSYVTATEELAGVRGRLDLNASLKQLTFARARAWCVFDELSPDVPHNRIVKTTLRALASTQHLDTELSEQLRQLYRRLPGVSESRLSEQSFRRVTLGRNNAAYGLLLDVCEFVYRNLLVDEATGESTFRDFTRDDRQMARVFEKFLFNFCEREQEQFDVVAPRFEWRAEGDPEHLTYLPAMRTDIVLRGEDKTIVVDAKYYSETLDEYFTKRSLRSEHLYQLFAYMSHLAPDEARARVSGILIYPRTTETVKVRARLFEHPFLAATINLSQPWPSIRNDLLSMLTVA